MAKKKNNTEVYHLKEVMELKFKDAEKALELQAKVYESDHREITSKIESLQKLVWIGVGFILTLQIIIKFLIK